MSANPDTPRIVSPPTSPETHHPKYETLLREFTHLLGAKLLVNGANCECSQSNDRLLRYLSTYQLPLVSVSNAEDTKIQDSRLFSFPSLTMFRRKTNHFERNSHGHNKETSSTSAESIAVRNLDQEIRYNRCDIITAPSQLAFNVSSSFASLTAANLRQYLKRHVFNDIDENLRAQKAKQMTASFFKANGTNPPTIGLQSISTSFDAPYLDRYSRQQIQQDMEWSYPEEVIMPLRFKAEITVNINQKAIEVSMETTGAITVYFNTQGDDSIKSAEITMDTARLLTSMRNGARMVALKAITKFSDDMAGVYDSDEERIHTLSKDTTEKCTALMTPEAPSNAVYVSPQITGKRVCDRNSFPPLKKRARLQMRSSNALNSNTFVRSTLKRSSLMTGLDVLRESRNDS